MTVGKHKQPGQPKLAVPRPLGLLLLAGAHLFVLSWAFLLSLFKPRYRPVVRFHWRYFRDVMAKETKTKADYIP